MAGGLAAQADFDAVDAVDGGVAGGGAAQHLDAGAGQEAQVREVVADGLGQVDGSPDTPAFPTCASLKAVTFVSGIYQTNLVLFTIRHIWCLCW